MTNIILSLFPLPFPILNNIPFMFNCKCFSSQDRPFRDRFRDGKEPKEEQEEQSKKSTPFPMKLLDALGLRKYIFNKYIFRKLKAIAQSTPSSTCKAPARKAGNYSASAMTVNYDIKVDLLEEGPLSVPVVHLRLKGEGHRNRPYIIYSHGNSSDLSDAYIFFSKLVKQVACNIVIYDYSGYGISKTQTTEQSLCQDLQLVIKWLGVPHQRIILWGFSLGSYPTTTVASRHDFACVILQSPIASAACFFDKSKEGGGPQSGCYELDCLDNLSNIGKIASDILILHSSDDEIIPVSHAYKLYSNVKAANKARSYLMLEVQKLKHNQMHYYLSEARTNVLSTAFREYLEKICLKVKDQVRLEDSYEYMRKRSKLGGSIKKNSKVEKDTTTKDTKEDEQWEIEVAHEEVMFYHQSVLEVGVKNHRTYFGAKMDGSSKKPKLAVTHRVQQHQ